MASEQEIAEIETIGRYEKTNRGFDCVTFYDEYGKECSLQESSRAVCENDDGEVDDPLGWVWLGIDEADPKILKTDAIKLGIPIDGKAEGWMSYPVPDEVFLTTRMHLNEKQVRGLVARLQMWLETGRFASKQERGD